MEEYKQYDDLGLNLPDIIDNTFKELVDVNLEYIEQGIDYFLGDNNVLKDIPVIGIVVSTIKTGVNIQNRIFAEKLFKFIESVNKGIVTEKEKEKYLVKMKEKKHRQKIGSTIFSFLNNFNELEKADLLGRLFTNYILGKYDYAVFVEFANVVENMMISDINLVKFLYENKNRQYYLLGNVDIEGFIGANEILVFSSVRRLINLNVVRTQNSILYDNIENPEEGMSKDGYFYLDGKHVVAKINDLGVLFYESIV